MINLNIHELGEISQVSDFIFVFLNNFPVKFLNRYRTGLVRNILN